MSKEFGQRLLNQMKKQGISQRQLADRLNTTEASLSRYVNGEREPKADMLANIATALNTTSDYLLGIENNDFDLFVITEKSTDVVVDIVKNQGVSDGRGVSSWGGGAAGRQMTRPVCRKRKI